LNALSPLATLARGYAVARAEDGTTLSSVDQFKKGTPFELRVQDGSIRAIPD
jgi:exodeoxyribonuclease VII large subunit